MATGGTVSVTIVWAMARKASAAGPVPSSATGSPASPPAATLGSIGTWPSSSAPTSSARAWPPPDPEQRVLGAVLAGEGAHVLDHARHPQERAPGHVGGPDGHLLGADRRGGDDDQVGAGQQASQAHLDVAGARRHVDEQVVERAPVHVAQELLDGLGQHQPSPHQRRALVVHQHPGGDHLQPAGAHDPLVGDDQRAGRSRRPPGPRGARSCPSMRGTEKPQMSASSTPTV